MGNVDLGVHESSGEKNDDKGDTAEFNGGAINWPLLENVNTGDRSIHDWVLFQNEPLPEDHDMDSDSFSLISELSESSWVDLAPKKSKNKLSFAEMLKRKSKNNFQNKIKKAVMTNQNNTTNILVHKADDSIIKNDDEEYFREQMKGTYRNHATKNSRKGFCGSYKSSYGRSGNKRSKNSIRRTCGRK